jgi:oxalate decarboxylase/phosphoglucose isomerase-like protein (cupin superfamily)
MKYIRIYSDENGESHFEELDIEFKSMDYAPPAPPLDVSQFMPANQYAFLRAPVGWSGDWHPAPFRQIHFYLAGEVDAEVSDGETRTIKAGDVVLVEDTSGKGHRSQNVGSTEGLIAVVKLDDPEK